MNHLWIRARRDVGAKVYLCRKHRKSRALWKETARLFSKKPRLLPKIGFPCPLLPTTRGAGGSLRATHRRSRTQNQRTMNDLLNLFIFAQTPVEELRRWLAETPHRFERYAPGERIIAQGAECRSALLLTAGTANTEMVQDGRDLAIDVLKAPMLLASAFLFGTENRMPVSVTAATECEVWTVNKEALVGQSAILESTAAAVDAAKSAFARAGLLARTWSDEQCADGRPAVGRAAPFPLARTFRSRGRRAGGEARRGFCGDRHSPTPPGVSRVCRPKA